MVAHHDWGSSATGQAFHKFNGETPIFGRLRTVLMRVEPKLCAEVLVQFMRATKSAA
jgi:hypothetical protein